MWIFSFFCLLYGIQQKFFNISRVFLKKYKIICSQKQKIEICPKNIQINLIFNEKTLDLFFVKNKKERFSSQKTWKKGKNWKQKASKYRKKSSTKSVFSLFSMILYWSFAQKKKNSLFFFLQIFLSIAYTEKSKNLPTGWHFEPFLWNHLSLLIHLQTFELLKSF